MGEVIALQAIVRRRRLRAARALHERCCVLLAEAVAVQRADLTHAPIAERTVRIARLRKLEELHAYAVALE